MEDEITHIEQTVETGHEPHAHARPRLLIGIVAIVCLLVAGLVWAEWGDEIKEACTGSKGACTVELPDEPSPPISPTPTPGIQN